MNLLLSVFSVGISVLGGGCIIYKSYNLPEQVSASSKSYIRSPSSPLQINPIENLDLNIVDPVAVS